MSNKFEDRAFFKKKAFNIICKFLLVFGDYIVKCCFHYIYKNTKKNVFKIVGFTIVTGNGSSFSIRIFDLLDSEWVVNIWRECKLVRDRNNSELDIRRKDAFQKELFFVGEISNIVIETAMFGYDGYRGCLNCFAVALDYLK